MESRTSNTTQRRRPSPAPPPLIPAAQYVRMSDEAQQFSTQNQKTAILEYAVCHVCRFKVLYLLTPFVV